MEAFRIVQLSDLHLSRYPSNESFLEATRAEWFLRTFVGCNNPIYPTSYSPDRAIKLLRQLDREQKHIDAIVISGDLATTGNAADLQVALDYLEGTPQWGWGIFHRRLPALLDMAKVALLPGNHDRFNGLLLRPGSTEFENKFGPDWSAGQAIVVERMGSGVRAISLTKHDTTIWICSADFTLRRYGDSKGKAGWLGQGRVYEDTLKILETATTKYRDAMPPAAVIWFVHFPPEFPGSSSVLGLLDDDELIAAAARNGVQLICAGHTHQFDNYYTSDSRVQVMCSGSAIAYETKKTNSYTEIFLRVEGNSLDDVVVREHVWDGTSQYRPTAK